MAKIDYYINSISGLWNSYGCPPKEGAGLAISIDTPNDGNESLSELCGFAEETVDFGRMAESKEISELVVILPMVDSKITGSVLPEDPPTIITGSNCSDCDEKNTNCGSPIEKNNNEKPKDIKKQEEASNTKLSQYMVTENAYLFLIQEKIINKILDVKDYKTLSIFEIKDKLDNKKDLNEDNNIVKLMRAMVKYNFPPHLNWLAFPKTVPPYAMYTAEFKSTLSKDDLTKIWQGVMPNIAENPEEEEIDIEHFLFDEEIFGNINIAEIENVKLKIFKCKKRANHYYNDLLVGQNVQDRKWYNYNWPYDNFSLIELLRVEAGEVHDFKNSALPSDGVLNIGQNTAVTFNSDGTTSVTINGYDDDNSVFNGIPEASRINKREY